MKKVLLGLLTILLIGVGALMFSGNLTKDRGDELSMALDNVNPLVKVTTVYGVTNSAVSHTKGEMGEDVFTYKMNTLDAHGNARLLTFTADHRLKQKHYLKIETKGQNVNSWEAVDRVSVPSAVRTQLTNG